MKIPDHPPDIGDLWMSIDERERQNAILAHLDPLDSKGRYLHWDEMRRRTPPDGLTVEEWWLATRMARNSIRRALPIVGLDGAPLLFSNVDAVQAVVHTIDQRAGGQIESPAAIMSTGGSDRYLVRSLVEEAITSSQLEGASTTRAVAKELLDSGRAPRDRDERMIVNNFNAMLYAQDLAESGDELTPEAVLELHRIVTDGTLDDPTSAGRLQTPEDERIAVWWVDGQLLHRPPPAEELPGRLEALCEFAAGRSDTGFTHPVVRAVLLHFMVGYDHPFEDGNGRTARAIFYWSMLKDGYWLAQYLSISTILKKAPSQYVKAYLRTETDQLDVTYFVVYQLDVICRAIDSLNEYLSRQIAEYQEVEALMRSSEVLNHRQVKALGEAMKDPSVRFTFRRHANRHSVTYQSARTDLLGLESLGLLHKKQFGRQYRFKAAENLADLLRAL